MFMTSARNCGSWDPVYVPESGMKTMSMDPAAAPVDKMGTARPPGGVPTWTTRHPLQTSSSPSRILQPYTTWEPSENGPTVSDEVATEDALCAGDVVLLPHSSIVSAVMLASAPSSACAVTVRVSVACGHAG